MIGYWLLSWAQWPTVLFPPDSPHVLNFWQIPLQTFGYPDWPSSAPGGCVWVGPTCYMNSTRNSLTPGRRLPDFHSSQPPHMGIRFNSWNSNHYKETYIYMVLGEGICPLQCRWAEKGLKGPGTLRPHNHQASCSHIASLCSSVCGSLGAWASPARTMYVILSPSSRGMRVECQFICAFSFSLAFLLYLWSPCDLSRYLNWVIF